MFTVNAVLLTPSCRIIIGRNFVTCIQQIKVEKSKMCTRTLLPRWALLREMYNRRRRRLHHFPASTATATPPPRIRIIASSIVSISPSPVRPSFLPSFSYAVQRTGSRSPEGVPISGTSFQPAKSFRPHEHQRSSSDPIFTIQILILPKIN